MCCNPELGWNDHAVAKAEKHPLVCQNNGFPRFCISIQEVPRRGLIANTDKPTIMLQADGFCSRSPKDGISRTLSRAYHTPKSPLANLCTFLTLDFPIAHQKPGWGFLKGETTLGMLDQSSWIRSAIRDKRADLAERHRLFSRVIPRQSFDGRMQVVGNEGAYAPDRLSLCI